MLHCMYGQSAIVQLYNTVICTCSSSQTTRYILLCVTHNLITQGNAKLDTHVLSLLPSISILETTTVFSDMYVAVPCRIEDFSVVAVPCRIKVFSVAYFDRIAVFKAPYRWTSIKGGAHMRFVDSLAIPSCIYKAHMSPALNGSSAIRRFEHSDAIEIRNGIIFDFYTGLSHMAFCVYLGVYSQQI